MDSTPLTPKTTGVLVPTTTPYALAVATELNDEGPLCVEVVISTSDAAALESAWTMGAGGDHPDAQTLAVALDRTGVLSLHHHLDVTLARRDIDPLPLNPDGVTAADVPPHAPPTDQPVADVSPELAASLRGQGFAYGPPAAVTDGGSRGAGYQAAVEHLNHGNPTPELRRAAVCYARDRARVTAAGFWADPEPDRAVPDAQPLSLDEMESYRRDAIDAIVNGRGPRHHHVAVLELAATVEAQARARAEEAVHGHYEGPGRMRLSRTEDTDELVIGTEVDGRVTDVYVPTHEAAQLGGLLLRCVARDLALAGVRRLLRVTEDVDVRLTQRRRAREGAR